MRAALACAILALAPSVARADECDIDYVTVPDGVKAVIEGWVAAEPHCRGTIALRVIPTKDGYYLFAERPDGTVHERLVPDVTAAGVLVASWVADSWRIERPKKKRKKRRVAVRATVVDEPAVAAAFEIERTASERRRWISLGGTMVPGLGDMGFRLESDLLVYGGWKLGAVVQKVEDTLHVYMNNGMTSGVIDDWSIGGHISHTFRWRGWELRGALGVYALGSKIEGPAAYSPYTFDIGVSPAFEMSATLARDLGDSWGVGLTLASTVISQTWIGKDDSLWTHEMAVTREETQPMWVLSLRRRI